MTSHWWKGERGEWFVAAQVLLIALVFFGPRRWFGWPAHSLPFVEARLGLAAFLALAGLILLLAALYKLGPNLTPFPRPKEGSTLVKSGPFALVRHPIYSGILLLSFGWAIHTGRVPTLLYALALALLLDAKAAREERWLAARYPEYDEYRQRVKKLIPGLY
jgi:protein-S-isoprenylcysteine O-methyltransferase Ste14